MLLHISVCRATRRTPFVAAMRPAYSIFGTAGRSTCMSIRCRLVWRHSESRHIAAPGWEPIFVELELRTAGSSRLECTPAWYQRVGDRFLSFQTPVVFVWMARSWGYPKR